MRDVAVELAEMNAWLFERFQLREPGGGDLNYTFGRLCARCWV